MKLLIVTQKIDRDDSDLGFFWCWVLHFAQSFEKVTVICLERGKSPAGEISSEKVEILSLGKEDGVSRAEYVRRFWKYIRERRSDYDCVLVHMNPEYVLLGGLFWRWWGKKVILWYTHGTVTMKLRIAVLLSSVTLTATKKSCRVSSKKVRVVGHGIDTEYFKEWTRVPDKTMKLITVGRVSPVKDFETIIHALGRVKEAGFQFVFTVVGGPVTVSDNLYLEKVKLLASQTKLTLGKDIVFSGPVFHRDVLEHLYTADLFLHASRTGSLDKVVLEAMATALPVLSSSEASKEVFGEHVEELPFREGDDEALAKKILAFSKKSQEERNLLGFKLHTIVRRNHSLTHLVNKIRELCAA